MNHCLRHYEEPITAYCRSCNHPFCTRCLVFSFGPKKPPFCVGCALHASGIRNGQRVVDAPFEPTNLPEVPGAAATSPSAGPGAVTPATDKRVERAYRRAERDAIKAAAKAAKRAARKGASPAVGQLVPTAPLERSSQVPAPSQLLARTAGHRSEG